MNRSLLRYTRRMLRVATGRFAGEEHGAVMVLTVIFALPLAYFMFITYNTGIAITTRMRAQNVADAATYTASLWQARFLNFCAYSRRQVLGNYATMALCTSYESVLKLYRDIYDAQGLIVLGFTDGDHGIIKTGMTPFYNILKASMIIKSDEYNDSDTTNPIRITRHAADAMNLMLSNGQLAMYLSLANGNKMMQKVVEEADRKAAVGGTGMEFKLVDNILNPLNSYSSMLMSMKGTTLIEKKAVTLQEVKYYCDDFTLANFQFIPGALNAGFIGRNKFPMPGMAGASPPPGCWDWSPRITSIDTYSEGCTIASDGSNMNSKDGVVPIISTYFYILMCFEIVDVPVATVILGPSFMTGGPEESDYHVKHNFNATKVYSIKAGVASDELEPTSFAIVEGINNMQSFFTQDKGLGKDISPDQLDKGDHIRAFSRAKAYFHGPNENMAGFSYDKPNLNYARWGAKLASLDGYSVTQLRVVGKNLSY